jgi:small conductance mechanosensitive channel
VLADLLNALAADPTVLPTATSTCQDDPLCEVLLRETSLEWLAQGSYYLLIKPVRIILIIIVALILRTFLSRLIKRLTKMSSESKRGLLHPLRERVPVAPPEAPVLRYERRRQRAEALGSVLRSIASIGIFSIAFMLILGELGVNLAPLIASAGIAGIALGFGAQNLVKDFIAGLFMLLEDQYGVGDVVDVGEASGTVEAVGLRITTIRDGRGVLWYIRNGEIVRVGNKSQGWALVVVDVPVGFVGVDEAAAVLRAAASAMTEDQELAADLLEAPEVLGVEQITVDGAVVRTIAKTAPEGQWRVARELRRRLTEALEDAGITQQMSANRVFVRPPHPTAVSDTGMDEPGVGGAT